MKELNDAVLIGNWRSRLPLWKCHVDSSIYAVLDREAFFGKPSWHACMCVWLQGMQYVSYYNSYPDNIQMVSWSMQILDMVASTSLTWGHASAWSPCWMETQPFRQQRFICLLRRCAWMHSINILTCSITGSLLIFKRVFYIWSVVSREICI